MFIRFRMIHERDGRTHSHPRHWRWGAHKMALYKSTFFNLYFFL